MNTIQIIFDKVKCGRQWLGNQWSRLARAIGPGRRAWRGAAWGVLLMVAALWSFNAYAAFGAAGTMRFVAGLLAGLLVAGLFGGILLALGWLLRRSPTYYRWILFSGLLLLLLIFILAQTQLFGALAVIVALILLSSLLGAGVSAVSGGNWRQLTSLHKGAAVTGLATGATGLLAGVAFLLADGFETVQPVNAATASGAVIPLIDLPHPAGPGPYPTLTLTYGSGDDRHRPEYGANVTLTTESVDGSALLEGWSGLRTSYWGFGPDAMPRNGRVWYPDSDGPFPLVLIAHGNHLMEEDSENGYAYLGQLLAGRGYIVASIDQNFLNLSPAADMILITPLEKDNNARAWLLLEHLRQWQSWHNTPGNPFYNKVDWEAIGLIGHSRGGEAVALAAAYSRLAYHPDDAAVPFAYDFDIRSVVAIAPVDGQYQPGGRLPTLTDVNYLVLHGAHDMDVVTFMGMQQYGRVHFSGDQPRFKATLYIYGANHGQFNSDWGRQDTLGLSGQLFNLGTLMPAAAQEQIAAVAISAFLEATLYNQSDYRDLFQDPRRAAAWLPDTIYLSQYQDAATLRLVTFEEDIDLRSTTLPGGQLRGENLTIWREQLVPQRWGTLDNRVVYLGWDQEVAEETARYVLTLPADLTLDEEAVLTFSLAAVDENPNPDAEESDRPGPDDQPPLDLTLVVADAQGREARLPLSHFSLLQPPLPARLGKADFMSILPLTEIVFQSFEFPLATFTAVNPDLDPHTIGQVQFHFDRTPAGVVALDEIGLRSDSAWGRP